MKNETQISLNSIKEVAYTCEEIPREIVSEKLSCRLGFTINPQTQGSTFNIVMRVEFLYGETKTEIMSYKARIIFDVIGIEAVRKVNNDTIEFRPDFLESILSITIGTLRGMVAVKTAGTILSGFPIPLVEVREYAVKHNIIKISD